MSAAVHVSLKKSQVVKTSDMGNGHLGDGFKSAKHRHSSHSTEYSIKVMIYILKGATKCDIVDTCVILP